MIEAFGPLPVEGRAALANQLIGARAQYVAHRISVWDKASEEGVCLRRLKKFCSLAVQMRQLLYRDGAEFYSWNLDPTITRELPELCRIASERGSSEIWDHNLTPLRAALADLSKLGDRARAKWEGQFPKTHGGKRREGRSPKNDLIGRLIDIYADLRHQYPGPAVAFNAPLKRFVRAGLAFTVSLPAPYADTDGRPFWPHPASFLEADLHLPKRTSDRVIEGVFNRSPHFKT